jgi:alkyl hydroperoxide reductase subunit AhpF
MAMALMNDELRAEVKEFLAPMDKPVTVLFHPVEGDPASDAMQELWTDLSALQPKIRVQTVKEPADPIGPQTADELESVVSAFSVDSASTGLRYLGFPGGYEFGVMLQALRDASAGAASEVSEETKRYVEALKDPVHLQVFTSPT